MRDAEIRAKLAEDAKAKVRGTLAFKAMIADMLTYLDVIEHRGDVPYMLDCEVKYLKATIEDVTRRMSKDFNGYEAS